MNINKSVLVTNHPSIQPSKISISNHFNCKQSAWNTSRGKFFVAIFFIGAIFTAPVTQAANLLFKSNFGKGVSLSSVYDFNNNYYAYQDIIGTDQETGYSWPITAFGAKYSGIHLWASQPIDSTNVNDHIENVIRPVTGPLGTTVNELFQNVKIKGEVGTGKALASLKLDRDWNIGDVSEAYITYWFYYPENFPDKLDSTISGGNWRDQFSWKTGGYNDTYAGDYRFAINIIKGKDNKLFWRTFADNVANGPSSKVTYWSEDNTVVPVPVGKWFKFEVYWKRSIGNDGRFWAAVDGQEIVDQYGANMGDYNLPVTRITINSPYSGGYSSVESHSTGLEIWDGFPCGEGMSCYSFDAEAPSTPAALSSSMTTTTATTTNTRGRKAKTSTTSTSTSSATVTLTWNASSDNVGVSGYYVYRNDTKIGTASSLKYTDSISSSTGTLYEYTIKAFDAAGNLSIASESTSVVY